jgi:hypothetical protein
MILTVALDVTPCSLVEISDILSDIYEGDCRAGFDVV